MKYIAVFFLLFLQLLIAEQTLIIATASKDSTYDKLAYSIKQTIEANTKYKIKIANTNGSVDNIDGILAKKFDMALVQSDILFQRHQKTDGQIINDILPIANFYKEPVYIVTYRDDIIKIKDLLHRNVNLGAKGSGLKDTAEYILNSANIIKDVQPLYLSPKESVDALIGHKVHAIFLNSISPNLEKLLKEKKMYIVPISETFIEKLHKTLPFFESYSHTIDEFACVSTVAVRVMFIVRADMDEETVFKIVESLHSVKDEILKKSLNPNHLFEVNPLQKWHTGVEKYANSKNIELVNGKSANLYWIYIILALIIALLLLFVVGILVLYYANIFHRFKGSHVFVKYSQGFYKWAIKHKYKLIVMLLLLFYAMCALMIKFFEHTWAIDNSKYSIFDSLTFWETLSWLFVFGSSGYSDNIFPFSPIAKFIASLIPFIGISGIFAMIGFYIFDKIKLYFVEVSGMGTKNTKNHIIICGWNHSAKQIVESLTHKNLARKDQIVILVQKDEQIEQIKSYNFESLYVSYIKGSANNRNDLDRVNIKDAKRAIVLSDENVENSDASVILSILTIETYCKELQNGEERSKKSEDCIYTVAEIQHIENTQLANDAGADQVVSLGGIESKIFTQAIMNPGIAKFMHEIMTYNDQNDVYSFIAEENNPLRGKTFDEILTLFRKHKVLLLSINVGYKKSKDEVQRIVKEHDLDDAIITNPFEESECAYKVSKGDLLIVLAQYQNVVDDALKRVGSE